MASCPDDIEKILIDHRVELVKGINLNSDLWDQLISRRIVTLESRESIEVSHLDYVITHSSFYFQLNRTKRAQKGELLDYLAKRPKHDYIAFCHSLCATNQRHIVYTYLWPSEEGDLKNI